MDFLKKSLVNIGNAAASQMQISDDAFVGKSIQIGERVYQVRKKLAEGGFAFVYVVSGEDGRQYALKRLLASDQAAATAIQNEIANLKLASKHENVVKYINGAVNKGDGSKPTEFLLLLELCPGGDLSKVFTKRGGKPLSNAQILKVFTQVVRAIEFLHRQTPPIIHRDIKSENYLVDGKGNLKLCDFGSATTKKYYPSKMNAREIQAATEEIEHNTTPQNRTPEMLDMYNGKDIDEKGDIWALGCILHFLVVQVHPFEDGSKLGIINGKLKLPKEGGENKIFFDLIRRMLSLDPANRPTATQILSELDSLATQIKDDKNEPIFAVEEQPAPRESFSSFSQHSNSQHHQQQQQQQQQQSSAPKSSGPGFFSKAMTDLVSSAKAKIRSVAQKDTRFHGGLAGDLDLSYITPKIIAMSFPSEGITATWSNGINEVRTYLSAAHKNHALVVNVSDKHYDDAKLGCKSASIGWTASGGPPPLEKLVLVCKTIHSFLLQDPENTVAVHCSNGKEETGVAVAAYFVYSQLATIPSEAARVFVGRRLLVAAPLLSISQLRYIGYIGDIIKGNLPHKQAVKLEKLSMKRVPTFNSTNNGCRPFVEVYENGHLVRTTEHDYPPGEAMLKLYTIEADDHIDIPLNVAVFGDVRIKVAHAQTLLGTATSTFMFAVGFHTGYVKDGPWVLECSDIDGGSRRDKFGDRFTATFNCKVGGTSKGGSAEWDNIPEEHKVNHSSKACFATPSQAQEFSRDFSVLKRSFADEPQREAEAEPEATFSEPHDPFASAEPANAPFEANFADFAQFPSQDEPQEPVTASAAAPAPTLVDFTTPATSSSSPTKRASQPSASFFDTPIESQTSSHSSTSFFDLAPSQQTQQTQQPPAASTSFFDLAPPQQAAKPAPTSSLLGDFDFGAPAKQTTTPPTASSAVLNPSNAAAPSSRPSGTFNFLGDAFPSSTASSKPSSQPMGSMSTSRPPTSGTNLNLDDLLGGPVPQQQQQKQTPSFDPFGGLGGLSSSSSASSTKASVLTPSSVPLKPAQASFQPSYQSQPSYNPYGPASSNINSALFAEVNQPQQQQQSQQQQHPRMSHATTDFSNLLGDVGFKSKPTNSGPTTMGDLLKTERYKSMDPIAIKIEEWTKGKEQNIRALLATMHDILWPGTTWKRLSLNDLVEVKQVERAYKMATIAIHPDKTAPENVDLAKAIFIEINQAFNLFKEKNA